jgi:hypothetical protein
LYLANVELLDLIQLGLPLSDEKGNSQLKELINFFCSSPEKYAGFLYGLSGENGHD